MRKVGYDLLAKKIECNRVRQKCCPIAHEGQWMYLSCQHVLIPSCVMGQQQGLSKIKVKTWFSREGKTAPGQLTSAKACPKRMPFFQFSSHPVQLLEMQAPTCTIHVHGTTHAKSTETSQCYQSYKMIKIIRKPDNYMYKQCLSLIGNCYYTLHVQRELYLTTVYEGHFGPNHISHKPLKLEGQ